MVHTRGGAAKWVDCREAEFIFGVNASASTRCARHFAEVFVEHFDLAQRGCFTRTLIVRALDEVKNNRNFAGATRDTFRARLIHKLLIGCLVELHRLPISRILEHRFVYIVAAANLMLSGYKTRRSDKQKAN